MKCFLVIPTLTAGGAERVMSLLANFWATNQDLEVHLVLLADDEIFYPLDERVIVHKLFFPVNPSLYQRVTGLIKLGYNLRKCIKKHKPDFLLSFMNKYNIFVLISSIGLKRKIFVSERGSPTEKVPRVRAILRNITYRYAAGIIAQTNSGKLFIERKTGNKNVTVIPNPIKKVEKKSEIKKEKILLNVGRLVEAKGQKYLIEAFSKISAEGWKLVFIGDGPLRQPLEQLAMNLKISQTVSFMGTIKDVDSWLNVASVFAFSSIEEGFPNALAEAMCAGLPCVSFDCETGPKELIENGVNGYLVEVGDVNNLADKINLLINNEGLRNNISIEAVKIQERLNIQTIANNFLTFCSN